MSTENVDPRYQNIDEWQMDIAVEAMLEGQISALAAIKSQVPIIAAAADTAAKRLGRKGRLIYAGAGTSGRIAVQDGVELLPTYNWPSERLAFFMAGGLAALVESAEGAEDDAREAERVVRGENVGPDDVVIGVAASGSTPFTVSVVKAARDAGALTIGISNNSGSKLAEHADYGICAETGSEIVAGSTRMKAGTAQKAVLNMLSTSIMIRRGLVYQGLMVNMRVSNQKLLARAQAMVGALTGVNEAEAARALKQADHEIGPAVLIALGADTVTARDMLSQTDGNLKEALAKTRAERPKNA